MARKILFVLFFISGTLTTAALIAAGGEKCCVKCGSQRDLQFICRQIHTTKYIEISCWDSVREDVCLPPRTRCQEGYATCGDTSDQLEKSSIAAADACKGLKIRSCNKLVRKTYLLPVPTVVWVAEYLCPSCRCDGRTCSALNSQ
jgi:hypothetical protein